MLVFFALSYEMFASPPESEAKIDASHLAAFALSGDSNNPRVWTNLR
jgi:hypothetical protein